MNNNDIATKILAATSAPATDLDIDDFSEMTADQLAEVDAEASINGANTVVCIAAIRSLGRQSHIKDAVSTAVWDAVFYAGANIEEAAEYGKSFYPTNQPDETMPTLTANYITTDVNSQDGTNYWFEVNGENYAISEFENELRLLDCDGCPIEDCNDHDNIKQLLIDADPCAFSKS